MTTWGLGTCRWRARRTAGTVLADDIGLGKVTTMTNDNTRYEEFNISGDDLLTKVRELLHEGNVRRVFLKNEAGETLLEIPLTAGLAVTVLTAALAPVLVAVGAIAALLSQVTVGVERRAEPGADEDGTQTEPNPVI
jgi:hypothetical protein